MIYFSIDNFSFFVFLFSSLLLSIFSLLFCCIHPVYKDSTVLHFFLMNYILLIINNNNNNNNGACLIFFPNHTVFLRA